MTRTALFTLRYFRLDFLASSAGIGKLPRALEVAAMTGSGSGACYFDLSRTVRICCFPNTIGSVFPSTIPMGANAVSI